MVRDPWAWTKEDKNNFGSVGSPMSDSIQPSNEQAPPPAMSTPDPVDQQLTSMALGKGIEATASGVSGALGAGTAAAEGMAAAVGTGAASGAGSSAAMLAAQNAGMGALAPQAAGLTAQALGAGTAATTAATTGAAATGAGALGAGGTAAMAALGPVGWTIGGLLLAKKFGLF